MSEPTAEPQAGQPWYVTGQTEDTQITPDGRVEHGVKVLFRTGSGVDSSVFIPNGSYNAESVRTAIAARAAAIDSVSGLTGHAGPTG